jgi:hypothetical protein
MCLKTRLGACLAQLKASGKLPADRRSITRLRGRAGDELVITKLDRRGRSWST